MGEDYVDMVSDWFFANANDNDVHEHFKCLEEVALHNAYLAEMSNGRFLTYNCSVEKINGKIIITPGERIINRVHINLKNKYNVEVKFSNNTLSKSLKAEMNWISLDK